MSYSPQPLVRANKILLTNFYLAFVRRLSHLATPNCSAHSYKYDEPFQNQEQGALSVAETVDCGGLANWAVGGRAVNGILRNFTMLEEGHSGLVKKDPTSYWSVPICYNLCGQADIYLPCLNACVAQRLTLIDLCVKSLVGTFKKEKAQDKFRKVQLTPLIITRQTHSLTASRQGGKINRLQAAQSDEMQNVN